MQSEWEFELGSDYEISAKSQIFHHSNLKLTTATINGGTIEIISKTTDNPNAYLILKKLTHPHIINILSIKAYMKYGTKHYDTSYPFFNVHNLEDLISTRIITPAESLQFTRELVDAVSYLHSNNVIHFDIKPANILVITATQGTISDQRGLKLIDFDLAFKPEKPKPKSKSCLPKLSRKHRSMTKSRSQFYPKRCGTIGFMAPELWYDHQNPNLDYFKCDVYSMGVTIYQMIMSKLPIGGTSLEQMEMQHRSHRPDPVITPNPDFSALIMRTLSKAAASRPKASEVNTALLKIDFKINLSSPSLSW